MKINLTEMMRIKGRLSDMNSEMESIFKGVNNEFENISTNINSDGLHQSIIKFQGNVTTVSQKLSQNMKLLEEFIERQLSAYSITNEEAKKSLQNLVSLLNNTFDENGEIITSNNSDNTKSASEKPNVNPPLDKHLTRSGGVFNGPSGKETYYNLKMSGVVNIMRNQGFSEEEYPYWVRDDGAKMLGDYVMVAADFNTRPRGTILETSLGTAIVCDTGTFAQSNPTQVDIAVDW